MGKFATINIKRAWVNIGYFSSSWSGGVEKVGKVINVIVPKANMKFLMVFLTIR